MEHLVYYDIAAAFVLLTALVAYHLRKYSDNFQSRVYRVMLYALLVVSTSDFLLFWEEIYFRKNRNYSPALYLYFRTGCGSGSISFVYSVPDRKSGTLYPEGKGMVVCTGLDCNCIAGSTVIYIISF